MVRTEDELIKEQTLLKEVVTAGHNLCDNLLEVMQSLANCSSSEEAQESIVEISKHILAYQRTITDAIL